MSRTKELDFLVAEENWPRGISWYESQFPSSARIRGESSPRYTMYPRYQGVPERMSSLVPNAKLIYLVRDPVDQIFSHYLWTYGHRYHTVGLKELVSDFESSQLVQTSRYFMQLRRYLRYFPSSSILTIPQEELKHARQQTLQRIFRFLGVDESFTSPEFERLRHDSSKQRQKTRAGAVVEHVVGQVVGKRSAARLAARAPHFTKVPFTRSYTRPLLDESLRAELVEYLRPDVERLREHTGLALDRWSF